MLWAVILNPAARWVALCAAVVAIGFAIDRMAYNRGYDAARAAQEAANATAFREIIEDYNNATNDPVPADHVDCLLRQLAGDGNGEDCRNLRSQPQ